MKLIKSSEDIRQLLMTCVDMLTDTSGKFRRIDKEKTANLLDFEMDYIIELVERDNTQEMLDSVSK